jgi:hypothetical protein
MFVKHSDGDQRLVLKTEIDRFRDSAALGTEVDPIDIGQSRDDPEVLIHVIDICLDIHRYFTGKQQLLLVELFGHFLLQRLVEELSKNDDKRKDKEQHEDKQRGGKKFLLLENENKALKHGVIYCTKRWIVKQLNRGGESCRGAPSINLRNKKVAY